MATRREAAQAALAAALAAGMPGVQVDRDEEHPQTIPAAGWVNVTEGGTEIADTILGDGATYEWELSVDCEVLFQHRDDGTRNAAFDVMLQQLGAALHADRTLGGTVDHLEIGEPEQVTTEDEEGAPSTKGGIVPVTLHYQTGENPLASA